MFSARLEVALTRPAAFGAAAVMLGAWSIDGWLAPPLRCV